MAKGKKSSKSDQEHYKRYKSENTWEKNKIRRLARHCKQHPSDSNAHKVLSDESYKYTRNLFKGNKPQPKPIRLKNMSIDERKTIEEQFRELLDSAELLVTRR